MAQKNPTLRAQRCRKTRHENSPHASGYGVQLASALLFWWRAPSSGSGGIKLWREALLTLTRSTLVGGGRCEIKHFICWRRRCSYRRAACAILAWRRKWRENRGGGGLALLAYVCRWAGICCGMPPTERCDDGGSVARRLRMWRQLRAQAVCCWPAGGQGATPLRASAWRIIGSMQARAKSLYHFRAAFAGSFLSEKHGRHEANGVKN